MFEIKNLNIEYPNGLKALRNVNLVLQEGKIYGVLGPSGAGKSSFLKGILNLAPCTGNISFRNRPIKDFAAKIAYVEQKENIDTDFPISVFQCVLLGTYFKLGLFKRPGKKEKDAAQNALERVNMQAYKNRQIGELSGGQFQRVLIARALVQDAELILMDEPFSGIDVQNEAQLMKYLKGLAASGKTILIVHHDLKKVKDYFDEVILINEKVIANGPTDLVFTHENLLKTYKIADDSAVNKNINFFLKN